MHITGRTGESSGNVGDDFVSRAIRGFNRRIERNLKDDRPVPVGKPQPRRSADPTSEEMSHLWVNQLKKRVSDAERDIRSH